MKLQRGTLIEILFCYAALGTFFARSAAGKCFDERTCSLCLNQPSCNWCADSVGNGFCWDKGGCGSGSDYTPVTDKDQCPGGMVCEFCEEGDNIFRVSYDADFIRSECVASPHPGCTPSTHVAGTTECYTQRTCSVLRAKDDRLAVEGTHKYPAGECGGRDCCACLDGTDKCEYFSETIDYYDVEGCVPSGAYKPGGAFTKLTDCWPPCSDATCAQCLNQPGRVFCAGDSEDKTGYCADECGSDYTTVAERNDCPSITCPQCNGVENIYRAVFGEHSVSTKCVGTETPGCNNEDHAVGTVRCYEDYDCYSLWKQDSRLVDEGEYPYESGSCFGLSCDDCLDGGRNCEYFAETVAGSTTYGCVPPGFIQESDTLTLLYWCPDTVRAHNRANSRCGQCKGDQIYRVEYGTAGVHGSCVETCTPTELPVGTTRCYDKTMCDQITDTTLMASGLHPYPAESCFTKDCPTCKAAIDESGKPLCAFLTFSDEKGKEIRGCVPTGFITGDGLSEPEECPSGNASDGVAA